MGLPLISRFGSIIWEGTRLGHAKGRGGRESHVVHDDESGGVKSATNHISQLIATGAANPPFFALLSDNHQLVYGGP